MATKKYSSEDWNYDMVAAIDIGTTFSGYGFSFKDNMYDIVINKDWGGETGMYKTPTTVLIDGKREFVAFGYRAEYEYGKLSQEALKEYDIFRNFKMILYHEEKLTRSTMIESVAGRKHSALEIFVMAIKFLKNHLIGLVKQQQGSVPKESRVKWVLTIPAIWNDKAKQFMREAAHQAGLIPLKMSKQLTLALEPEAASVLYSKLEVNLFKQVPEDVRDSSFPVGTQYMIIDAGGGTVDVTTHEIQENGKIKEIICASGGNWGGNGVNNNFKDLLEEVLGKDFILTYRKENQKQWFKLMNSFERKKQELNMDIIGVMQVDLPLGIDRKFKEETGKDIEEIINNASGVSFDEDAIVLSSEIVSRLFNSVIDEITDHVKSLNKDIKKLEYIILAGGFGECKLLYNRFKQEFSGRATVISPHAAGLSIIKGAVLFGFNPSIITTRISRKTYGYTTATFFHRGKRDPSIPVSGEPYWLIFEVVVDKNEALELNDVKVKNSYPRRRGQEKIEFPFFSTDSHDVIYADDPGLTNIGTIQFDFPPLRPDSQENRYFRMEIKFGGTEIEFAVHGEIKNLTIDFLAD